MDDLHPQLVIHPEVEQIGSEDPALRLALGQHAISLKPQTNSPEQQPGWPT